MCLSLDFELLRLSLTFYFFFFNDTATTEIYTLSLHDALPILLWVRQTAKAMLVRNRPVVLIVCEDITDRKDRKSTRLNSSHSQISYAVFCLKKKKINRDRELE